MIVQAQAARGIVTNHCSTHRGIRLQRQLVVGLPVELAAGRIVVQEA